jgi:hypothetical protein
MTKKDYVLLASALADAHYHATQFIGGESVWERCVDEIADSLSEDNPRFDRKRFVAACQERVQLEEV